MKMDTVWQAKVADSAIKTDNLDVAGAQINLKLGLGLAAMGKSPFFLLFPVQPIPKRH